MIRLRFLCTESFSCLLRGVYYCWSAVQPETSYSTSFHVGLSRRDVGYIFFYS